MPAHKGPIDLQEGLLTAMRDDIVRIQAGWLIDGSVGVEHGQAVIGEIRLLLDAGCTIEKAVQCASHNGARLLDLQRAGVLRNNMFATLIAVEGDPSHLPESLNHIKLILIRGKQIDSNNKVIKS